MKNFLRKILIRDKFKTIFKNLILSKYKKIKIKSIICEVDKNSILYNKNSKLHLLADTIITPSVLKNNSWDSFVYNFIKKINTKKKYFFFDIGAHVGLISLQINNLKSVKKIICFEPLNLHFDLLKKNLVGKKFILNNFGLTDKKNSSIKIYTNKFNSGHTSAVDKSSIYENVELKNINFIFNSYIKKYKIKNIIYKSDVEGMDEILFSSLNNSTINRVDIAFLEITNFNYILKNWNLFIKKIKVFNFFYNEKFEIISEKNLFNLFRAKVGFNLILKK